MRCRSAVRSESRATRSWLSAAEAAVACAAGAPRGPGGASFCPGAVAWDAAPGPGDGGGEPAAGLGVPSCPREPAPGAPPPRWESPGAPLLAARPGLEAACFPGRDGLPDPRPAGCAGPPWLGVLTCPVAGSMRLRSRITGPVLLSSGELIRRRRLLPLTCPRLRFRPRRRHRPTPGCPARPRRCRHRRQPGTGRRWPSPSFG
jgi:hypothetical protein